MISDETLACQTLQGELSAFEELVARYKRPVFAIIYRMIGQYQEAEDITQDVFVTVYEKLYQFDQSKKFGPWIYQIATNSSISALRKKRKVIILNYDENIGKVNEQPYNPVYIPDPHLMFEKKELKDEIDSAILELHENYKAVIILRYKMDLNNQEIADILNISKENVEVKVHRARKALRKIILRRWEERGIKNELPASR